ncbi:MAG: S-layer homology domain-containing protein [Eubacteriales bacterium]|nr:S-layer homology domain-containing protein [Eubacteriales bacterium]
MPVAHEFKVGVYCNSDGKTGDTLVTATFKIDAEGNVLAGWDALPPSSAPTGAAAVTASATNSGDVSGSAIKSGAAGVKLTASGASAASGGTLSYKWYKGTVSESTEITENVSKTSAEGDTLTLGEYRHAKAGTYIAVPYNTETGKSATAGTQGSITLTTTKIAQATAVTVSKVGSETTTTVKVKAAGGDGTGGYQVAIVANDVGSTGASWQNCDASGEFTFTGLTKNTDYDVYAKRLTDNDYEESAVSTKLDVKTADENGYLVSVAKSGDGTDKHTVTVDGGASAAIAANTQKTIVATAAAGYSFNGWTASVGGGTFGSASTASTTYTTPSAIPSSNNSPITLTAAFKANELVWSDATLTAGTINTAYNQTLTAPTNGTGTYTYALKAGSALPEGLSLNGSTGAITGTPTKAYAPTGKSFTITATDTGSSKTKDATFTLVIGKQALDGTAQFTAGGTAPVIGTQITAELNTTSAASSDYTVSWYRSDDNALDAGDTKIEGATALSYTPVAADAGKYLIAVFTGTDVNYTGTKSVATGAAVSKKTQSAVVTNVTIDDDKNEITFTKNADTALTYEYTVNNGTNWYPVKLDGKVIGITGGTYANTDVQIRVAETAEAKAGSGVAANSGSFTVPAQVTGTPADLALTKGVQSIKAEWSDYANTVSNTKPAAKYMVYVYDGNVAISKTEVAAPDPLTGKVSTTLTGLTGGKTYGVAVSAVVNDTQDYEGDQCGVATATPDSSAPSPSGGGGGGGTTSYKVTFSAGADGKITKGGETVYVNSGSKLAKDKLPAVTANDGYKFLGWSLDGKTVVDPTEAKVTKAVTYTALYEKTEAPAEPKAEGFVKDRTEGYINGYPDGTFRPEAGVTRGEVAAMIARTILPSFPAGQAFDSAYNDLGGHWAAKYIGYLESLGVVNGYPDGSFKPDQTISRAEFVAMVIRVDGLVSGANAFTDVQDSYWAADYIIAAAEKDYVGGYPDGTFQPLRDITRAEAAKIVNSVLGWADKKADGEMRFSDVAEGFWGWTDIVKASNGVEA